jgi:inner membrane transporter RhtA
VTAPERGHETTVGVSCVLAAAVAIQSSAAIAIPAFGAIGALATSGFRFVLGAVVLVLAARPRVRALDRAGWRGVVTFGVFAAAMNVCFYQAVARLPLGTAVSIEFLGPFTLAVVAGRGWRHAGYAALALVGVVLLARPGGGVTALGALFAALAATCWAGYTLASKRLGARTAGLDGLALALCVSALLVLPLTAGSWGTLTWSLLGRLLSVAVLAVVVGFALELAALRRLDAATVAVLLSLNPAVAFAVGWLVLGQHVSVAVLLGGCCVVIAGIGVTSEARRRELALPPA